jgi:hypothetical protein
MSELQMLADLITELANRIAETDKMQADTDMAAGAIEGRLAAYREMMKGLARMIDKAV